ncbi:DUF4124 domain-containing protein [Methylobacillus gramineus]|uniref:DUF4124 domain-containing protein n=1 Tax=Methylobacillus gramineus TaxID=755169 RepID=UPI001CFF67EB|nr:DUF4124 domain-containing protein [Methylobacillus gramineus]MCB5185981.1 DUF4124 domain-containing protein [Methylobacillus gramineus]
MHRSLHLFTLAFALAITSSLLCAAENKPAGKIIKWVDENGVTHYGDTIPPQYAGKPSTNINSRGMPQREQADKSTNNELPANKETEQSRRDRTLQSVYSSEQEIDLARDRNLQMDQVMLEGLEQRKLGATTRLQGLKQSAADLGKRNKPVSADLNKDIKDATLEIGKIDEQMVERKQHMDATRQRFDNDRRRFTELKTGVPAGAESPSQQHPQKTN